MGKSITYLFSLTLVLLLMISSVMVGAEHSMCEQVGNGEIDWETGLIHVVGYGVPPQGAYGAQAKLMARGAAKADAYRNAVEVLKGVRVDSQSYVRNYVMQSDEIRTSVDGFVQGARIIGVNQQADGMVEVILELPLGGQAGLSTLLHRPVVSIRPDYLEAQIPSLPSESSQYTGVIIDARNLQLKPALYPQIFDTNGYLLYNSTMVEMDRPGFTTVVAYARSLELAGRIPRVGKNPLLLSAVSSVQVAGGEKTDLTLNSEAAKAFRELGQEIIKKAAVVFVID